MTANKQSRKVKVFVFAIAGSLLLSALAGAIALELGGLPLLHWAAAHPTTWAKHDPHHWISRLLALCILLSLGRAALMALRDPTAKFLAWRRVFLPWHRQKQAEAKQPVLETLE